MTAGDKLDLAWALATGLEDHVAGSRTKIDKAFVYSASRHLARLLEELKGDLDDDALDAEERPRTQAQ